MSEKQTAKFVLETDRIFNEDMKKEYGDAWPAEGMTWKEWMKIQRHRQQENEAKEAFSKVIQKESGLSLSEIKKADSDPDWYFFWGFGAAINRDLKIDWVKNRLQKAIEQNDLKFFIRFGNELKKKPRQYEPDEVALILARYWTADIGTVPPLSWFTDEALLEFLTMLTHNEELTFDQVRKTRQRLGLKTKKTDGLLITGLERLGNKKFRFKFKRVDKAKK